MPENDPASENQIEGKFRIPPIKDLKKQAVDNSTPQIAKRIAEIEKDKTIENKNKEKFKFGATFEVLATEENCLKHTETMQQRQLRQLIEFMYSHAELILGTQWPSKPDGISVIFDDKGHLIIDEIIEIKSSENAFDHGINKQQPPKTIQTIGSIVTILNRLIAGEGTGKIKPANQDLSLDKRIKRDHLLKQVQEQIKKIVPIGEKITYSPDLIYKVIVPHGVEIPQFDPHFLEAFGYAVIMQIVESEFSKRDIHKIIDHYAETP